MLDRTIQLRNTGKNHRLNANLGGKKKRTKRGRSQHFRRQRGEKKPITETRQKGWVEA